MMSVFKDTPPENQTVALCYTFSEALSQLVVRLGKMGRDVIIFNRECPELEAKIQKLIKEVKILIPTMQIKYSTNWQDTQKASIIVFLNVDIEKQSSDQDFYAVCKKEFKLRTVPKESLVIFSGNYRGLIAATVYCLAHPSLAKRVHVISSIYYASVQIFGESEKSARVLSKPGGQLFVFGGSEDDDDEEENLKKVENMRGIWAHDDFQTLESEALFNAIDLALSTGNISSCELTGRLPGNDESKQYSIAKDIVTWLPVSAVVQINAKGFLKNVQGISTKIEEVSNDYTVPLEDSGSDNPSDND